MRIYRPDVTSPNKDKTANWYATTDRQKGANQLSRAVRKRTDAPKAHVVRVEGMGVAQKSQDMQKKVCHNGGGRGGR